MKIVVCVVVYNRLENIKRLIDCWKQCNKENAELRIIHNYDNLEDCISFERLCKENQVNYIKRPNIGMDIGAFQDVCKERLKDFDNSWDYIIWFTDDTIIMNKDFINQFISMFNLSSIGCSCLEISKEVKPHIRTTGFCIKKETSKKLIFLKDKIISKKDCYDFEHRGNLTLLDQIKNMKLNAIMISQLNTAPLWDIGNRGYLNRWVEFYKQFPKENKENKEDKIVFIATIYNSFPEIVSSLINQTYQNWELLLIHDGRNETELVRIINAINDSRIKFIERINRENQWGHPIRKWALENLNSLSADSDYVVITNSDNHYVPHFCEYMLKGFKNKEIIATYCSGFVHAYDSHQEEGIYKYGLLKTKLELGWIDCGMVMVKKEIAVETGWNDMSHSSDWTYFNKIITKYGKNKWNRVLGNLFIHN
jgi:GT2 family glycosyltransferase